MKDTIVMVTTNRAMNLASEKIDSNGAFMNLSLIRQLRFVEMFPYVHIILYLILDTGDADFDLDLDHKSR